MLGKLSTFSFGKLLSTISILATASTTVVTGAVFLHQITKPITPTPVQQVSSTLNSNTVAEGTLQRITTPLSLPQPETPNPSAPVAANIAPTDTSAQTQSVTPSAPQRLSAAIENTTPKTDTISDKSADNTPSPPPVVPPALPPGTKTFTLAQLATDNGQNGLCYVAHAGTVYDVSTNPFWVGCQHHSAHGGTDITAIFPHPLSRLAGIPIVGTLITASGTPVSTPVRTHHEDSGNDD